MINWFAPYVDLAADVASFPLRLGMWAMEGRKDGRERERERRGERKNLWNAHISGRPLSLPLIFSVALISVLGRLFYLFFVSLSFHSFSSSADAVCLFVVGAFVSKLTLAVVILSFLYRPPPLDPWSRQLKMRQQLPFFSIGMCFIQFSCHYPKPKKQLHSLTLETSFLSDLPDIQFAFLRSL